MVALGQLLLPGAATKNRVTVLVNAIDKVLAGNAETSTVPTVQLTLINKTPLLHNPKSAQVPMNAGKAVGSTPEHSSA